MRRVFSLGGGPKNGWNSGKENNDRIPTSVNQLSRHRGSCHVNQTSMTKEQIESSVLHWELDGREGREETRKEQRLLASLPPKYPSPPSSTIRRLYRTSVTL